MENLTKDEISLLLYLESCSVDQMCRIDHRKMTDIDYAILKTWKESGYVLHGRMPGSFLLNSTAPNMAEFVILSEDAKQDAYYERWQRALRQYHRLEQVFMEYGKTLPTFDVLP